MALNKIKQEKKKFLTTMVIIIVSATMVNYGIYSLLDIFFDTIDTVYTGVQMNIIFTTAVIGIVTILMLAILPKQSVDELMADISGAEKKHVSAYEMLQDMIEEDRKKDLDD